MIRILVPLDGSTAAEAALDHACAIAKAFPAELHLLRVVSEAGNGAAVHADSVDLALWRHQAKIYLEGLLARHENLPGGKIHCDVAEGHPAETIIRYMKRLRPDLLIMTRYGHGNAQDFAAGGTAQKIVSSVQCSVLLLDPHKPRDPGMSYHRILVPVDESKHSECAVTIAAMIAEIHRASLLLLQVIEEPHLPTGFPKTPHLSDLISEMQLIVRQESRRRLEELAARVPQDVKVETRVLVSSETALAIESTAEDYDTDLLILHTRDGGPKGQHRYDAANHSLIQYSHRPLFILQFCREEGFASNFRSVYMEEQCREAI